MAETTVSAEVGFIFNTLLFLICGFLVMFMAAGFAMLESGRVTSKSVSVICAKNIVYFRLQIMFWMVGYNLAYGIPAVDILENLRHGRCKRSRYWLFRWFRLVFPNGFLCNNSFNCIRYNGRKNCCGYFLYLLKFFQELFTQS